MAAVSFQLDAEKILETVGLLERRIEERFPGSGLGKICHKLLDISRHARARAEQIARPHRSVRVACGTVIALIVGTFIFTIIELVELSGERRMGAAEAIQALDAGFNAVVLVGAVVLFVITLEQRLKRRQALKALHELRAVAHVIDMHQLTKDPERTIRHDADTKSSPKREMTSFQLTRYLDYCSEMLSLTGKVAALYAQHFDDSTVVAAVNDIEDLSSGLARKIWQKIMVIREKDVKGDA